VVVADKYNVPELGNEASKGLETLLNNSKPGDMVEALMTITEGYGDFASLEQLANDTAFARLKDVASTTAFLPWLTTQSQLLQKIVDSAVKFGAKGTQHRVFKCGRCDKEFLQRTKDLPRPKCCGVVLASEDFVLDCTP